MKKTILSSALLLLIGSALAQTTQSAGSNQTDTAVASQPSTQPSSQPTSGHTGDTSQANNPIADFKVIGLQNYYIGDLTGALDGHDANQLWLRAAIPFKLGDSQWITRLSLPVNTVPSGYQFGHNTGLGDTNILLAYLFDTGNPAVSFGIGPQLNIPTGDDETLGTGKWSTGLANAFFDGRSKRFQYGYLLSWWTDFAGDEDRADVNAGFIQPFAFYQLGGGTYLRAAPYWSYNFENDSYSVPLGIGVGQVIKSGGVLYNFYIEPQWSVADQGDGWSEWQVLMGVNLQFK